jgi:sec-independent protein translocase protein TatA
MFSGLESPMHLLVLAVIAAIVLGPKRLPELGRSLGHGIRGFKDSLEGEEKRPD